MNCYESIVEEEFILSVEMYLGQMEIWLIKERLDLEMWRKEGNVIFEKFNIIQIRILEIWVRCGKQRIVCLLVFFSVGWLMESIDK